MTIGAYLLTKDRAQWLSPSLPYFQTSIGLAVRENFISASPFSQLAAPFNPFLWLIICIVLCTSMMIILLTKALPPRARHFFIGGRMNRTPILNMINLFLGGLLSNRTMRHLRYFGTFARTLTMFWILLSLFLRKSYEGTLFSFLQTHEAPSQCDTVEKVRSSDCKIVIWTSGIKMLNNFVSDDKRYLIHITWVSRWNKIIFSQIHPMQRLYSELYTRYSGK